MAVRRYQFGRQLERRLARGEGFETAMKGATRKASVKSRRKVKKVPKYVPGLTYGQMERWRRIRRWRRRKQKK